MSLGVSEDKKTRKDSKGNGTIKILVSDKLAEEALDVLKAEKTFQVDVKTGLSPEELK